MSEKRENQTKERKKDGMREWVVGGLMGLGAGILFWWIENWSVHGLGAILLYGTAGYFIGGRLAWREAKSNYTCYKHPDNCPNKEH